MDKEPMIEVEQLGSRRPCKCGKEMVLGVKGQQDTPHGPVLVSVWSCFGCGNKEEGGVVNVVFRGGS